MQLVSSTSTSSMKRPIGGPPSVSLLGLLAKIKSVVSVLISLISDTIPIGDQDISPIFAVRQSAVSYAQPLPRVGLVLHLLPGTALPHF